MILPHPLPYCGAPPDPTALLTRFNFDPRLLLALLIFAGFHLFVMRRRPGRGLLLGGWLVAAFAFISPLCALSVSLFSARVTQHMLLVLVAAPLLAARWPVRPPPLWGATACFFLSLWFWHMPVPYDATFRSSGLYWSMHLSLFGSAILLWAALLAHARKDVPAALAAGTISSMQMGLLGALLSLANRPLFTPHQLTTAAWGITPLADQQLGGAIMWVPGIFLFLWLALWAAGGALSGARA